MDSSIKRGADALFILLGAIMVLAMHAGFAFLELGTVRRKTRSMPWSRSWSTSRSRPWPFFVGYSVAYGVNFFSGAEVLAARTATNWSSSSSC